jgi:hypothetical protein
MQQVLFATAGADGHRKNTCSTYKQHCGSMALLYQQRKHKGSSTRQQKHQPG